jgi:hypothetical protein
MAFDGELALQPPTAASEEHFDSCGADVARRLPSERQCARARDLPAAEPSSRRSFAFPGDGSPNDLFTEPPCFERTERKSSRKRNRRMR